MADVIFHYNNLSAFKKNKQYLQEQFPKKFTGIQLQKLEVLYEQMIEDDELMRELEDIIQYASKILEGTISSGTEIYELVVDNMSIAPVGLVPLDLNEGYFFLSTATDKNTKVYQYRLSIFEKHNEKYRSIKTEYIDTWYRSFVNNYESIKGQLIRNRSFLPNPAVYAIDVSLGFPVDETILPIAKRSLVRHLTLGRA